MEIPFIMATKRGENMVDLKKIREGKGLTQEQLAKSVGVVRQTISNIECGISKPSIWVAMAIGKELEFNWTEFYVKE